MAKAKPETETIQEVQTFTLGDKTYDIASIPEEYMPVFNDVNIIEGVTEKLKIESQKIQTQIQINNVARDAMVNKFKECISALDEVPTTKAEAK